MCTSCLSWAGRAAARARRRAFPTPIISALPHAGPCTWLVRCKKVSAVRSEAAATERACLLSRGSRSARSSQWAVRMCYSPPGHTAGGRLRQAARARSAPRSWRSTATRTCRPATCCARRSPAAARWAGAASGVRCIVPALQEHQLDAHRHARSWVCRPAGGASCPCGPRGARRGCWSSSIHAQAGARAGARARLMRNLTTLSRPVIAQMLEERHASAKLHGRRCRFQCPTFSVIAPHN